ncbi:MAG: ATP-binding protein [Oscillospiraceae bacterium]
MKKSIFKGTVYSLCVGLSLCLVLFAIVFDVRGTQNARREMENTAAAFALAYNPKESANEQARAFSNAAKNMRITIISQDGTVLGDSEADYKTMENHGDREEIKAAKAAKVGATSRVSETLGKKMVYAAVRTQSGDYVRLAGAYGGLLVNIAMLLPLLLVAAAFSLLVAAGVAKKFAASIAKPINELSDSLKLVKDGSMSLEPSAYPYEELQDMAADINDISAEVSAGMQRLESEKARIDYILDNMYEGFVLLDENDMMMLINTAACQVFGCAQEAVKGKNILHATRNISLLDAIAEVHKNSGHTRVQMPLPQNRFGEVNISTVSPSGGVIIIIHDDTERINVAKMRQEFFQSASHELKTPITSIQGFAELLGSDMPVAEEKQKEIFARISKEAARMTTLINDIIMISRLESGDIPFEAELVDIGALVSEVCADAESSAEKSNVSIICKAVSAVRTASKREMCELVSNLVQNAIKYNKDAGRVEVNLANNGGALTLTVFNTGEIIPPEYRTRVFERFFRIDKGRSKAQGGTGLGLAIVKHIASRYNASVFITAKEDGNLFTVNFPKEF